MRKKQLKIAPQNGTETSLAAVSRAFPGKGVNGTGNGTVMVDGEEYDWTSGCGGIVLTPHQDDRQS
jgi:hypothetical protein